MDLGIVLITGDHLPDWLKLILVTTSSNIYQQVQNISAYLAMSGGVRRFSHPFTGLKDISDRTDVIVDANPLVESEKPKNAFTIKESARFKFGLAEMVGRRPTMEDRFCIQYECSFGDLVD